MTTETLFWTVAFLILSGAAVLLMTSLCIISAWGDRAMEESRREEADEFERRLKAALGDEKWRAHWAAGIAPRMDEEVE